MAAPGYDYVIVAMAALGYGGPQSRWQEKPPGTTGAVAGHAVVLPTTLTVPRLNVHCVTIVLHSTHLVQPACWVVKQLLITD